MQTDGLAARAISEQPQHNQLLPKPGRNAMLFSKPCRLGVSESSLISPRGQWAPAAALAAQTSHSTSIRIGINMGKRGTR